MIEAYAFFAVFPLQILAASVLYPAWFIRYIRRQTTSIPAERLAQMYPDVDIDLARERFVTRYRALHAGIIVLGLLLLGWLFNYMRRPDWDDGPVEALVTVYFMMQFLVPLSLVIWAGVRFNKAHPGPVLESKRKATLQRRGLFDFISPFAVGLAVLSYFLFAAFVLYIQRDPFPGFQGYLTLGIITLGFAVQAFVVYVVLYGKKANPFETHEGRLRSIGLIVRCCVYSCIAVVVFLSINFTLVLLDLQRWEPFALSVFYVVSAILSVMGMIAPPRQPEANGPGSGGRLETIAR
jgi:hypothetical protein